MSHSPTPWTLPDGLQWLIADANGAEVGLIDTRPDTDAEEDLDGPNAQRIVACVNACEDLPDPAKIANLLVYLRSLTTGGYAPDGQVKAAVGALEVLGVPTEGVRS